MQSEQEPGRVSCGAFCEPGQPVGSAYHESKWAAEELVRPPGLAFTNREDWNGATSGTFQPSRPVLSEVNQAAEAGSNASIILYDGVCGLCNQFVQLVLRHDRQEQFRFAALQSQFAGEALRRYGRDPSDLSSLYVIVDPGGPWERLLAKSRAVLYVYRQLGGPGSISRVLAICPTGVLDAAYDLVARNRYSIFGESRTCLLPTERWKGRFLDR